MSDFNRDWENLPVQEQRRSHFEYFQNQTEEMVGGELPKESYKLQMKMVHNRILASGPFSLWILNDAVIGIALLVGYLKTLYSS